ncbi:MAG: PTS fructose transporter subunit IIA [Rhodoferax sp.]|jgi:PTS system ascorbate-specific IIA component|nr:PTS fructose transporter subunit IIA [Rhodoferax sp.]
MTAGLLIIAHSPLASALRECVLHVFADSADVVAAVDIRSDLPFDQLVEESRQAMAALNTPRTLVFTDVFGATPCNVAQKLVDGGHTRLIAGVNLPMLLRAMTYRREPIEALVARAMAGGVQGVMQVATAAPQNQARKKHDQNPGDHQQ